MKSVNTYIIAPLEHKIIGSKYYFGKGIIIVNGSKSWGKNGKEIKIIESRLPSSYSLKSKVHIL